MQDGLTGSAWGDWANYTASPLRAFENELGVQAGTVKILVTQLDLLVFVLVFHQEAIKIALKSKTHVKILLPSNTQAWIMTWACRLLPDFGTPQGSQLTGASRTSSDVVRRN